MSVGKFDAAIVGGGPAGTSAAYFLAKKGYQVILLERGKTLGSKNVYGGRIYSKIIKDLFPDFEKDAPIHRWVNRELFSIVQGGDSVTLSYNSKDSKSFTANLTEFCSWLGKKAEEVGANVFTEAKVTALSRDGEKVNGIYVGEEKVDADVVVIAEGANRLLSEKSGLAPTPPLSSLALGIKESIRLGKENIENRLSLQEGEGVSWMFLGDFTEGIPDGGFLYTFRDYLSLGVVVSLGEAVSGIKEQAYLFLEKLRNHPMLANILRGGETIEYSAHLTIVEPTRYMPKKLSGNGYAIIGDSAGLLGNLGYTFRGVDFAVFSGYALAESFEKIRNGDWESYEEFLKSSWVYKEILRFSRAHDLMKEKRMLESYPLLLNKIMKSIFDLEGPAPKLMEAVLDNIKKSNLSPLLLLRDMIKAARDL
ncbi:MAG: FAD-dependent oxidoreductase [Fervidicoccaceae archaeon]